MWITLLVMAAAVSLEPFRIGMTVLILNRPRPLPQLAVFLLGGFAMGITVGLIVLFILTPALGSTHFNLPRVQIAVGVSAIVIAALVTVGTATGLLRPRPDRTPGPLEIGIRRLLEGHSLWTAGAVGLGTALPSVDYLAALALIVASGAAAATQIGALLIFNVVSFALVEAPLVAYMLVPNRTSAALSAVQEWLQTHRHRKLAAILAVVGGVLLLAGVTGLSAG
ncbi:GAP family protein [Mycobacteroides abscessus]|uniref:GAP family protein n=1 Tax=Mycobacteroides abscessus TaxID=36809 RepID=UPI00038C6C81|nr:GAP family protein [Mycobacteroides abscessus]EPZ18107.1 gap like protein [Mycobacteroides abscessus V06705]MBN7548394.1 GAP family protein [Mycobacteroides abscessus subsp. abscessus]MDM2692282.1 GAP family protein [Mycobacteroides abscessus]MDM2697094.1 GAP family protein [Mycobacteroides abscessus]MDM2702182.1 GAP family protein [Mycobacteroides abscessus]